MKPDILDEVNRLQQMTVTELRSKYSDVFGEECRSFNKPHLVKRIAWRLQAEAEGGLSERCTSCKIRST